MNTNLKINHLAILVCLILSFGLGFLWYGPIFGESWMAMVGLDASAVEANPPGVGVWITDVVARIAPLYVLAWLFTKLNVRNGLSGAGIALLIVFSFDHLSRMAGDMFAKAPYELAWITGGYDMTMMTISGFILGAWIKIKKED